MNRKGLAGILTALSLVAGATGLWAGGGRESGSRSASAGGVPARAFEERFASMSWEEIVAEARGQTVHWYMWGGSDLINRFVTGYERLLGPFDQELFDEVAPRAWKLSKLPAEWQDKFAALPRPPAVLPPEVLSSHKIPELQAPWLEAIEKGWVENVLQK